MFGCFGSDVILSLPRNSLLFLAAQPQGASVSSVCGNWLSIGIRGTLLANPLEISQREKKDPFMSRRLEQLCSYDFPCDLSLMWDGRAGSAPHGENGSPQ